MALKKISYNLAIALAFCKVVSKAAETSGYSLTIYLVQTLVQKDVFAKNVSKDALFSDTPFTPGKHTCYLPLTSDFYNIKESVILKSLSFKKAYLSSV